MKKKVTYKKMAELLNKKFGCKECDIVGVDTWYAGQIVLWASVWTKEMQKFLNKYRTTSNYEFTCVGHWE